ncbi:hypothetical protein AKJ44_01730 [candidate division MSBL1 archaeon SCGC-AAA261F17]|uniref:4Fe-4S ferredoxin-type domain-containing protein n=1 Tax=candidate division MSBL1 archaeon SCGC-AAA261F17 TaxID=1698274 RepID=A0A133V6A3_9EURY|nr:hypothetical protein AKJ44_01730 [candidate division MSBL1 archaeon SCGC-AAA261F17]
MRWGMVIKLKRCVGCQTCLVACSFGNAFPPTNYQNKTIDYEEGEFPDVERVLLPALCMHCGEAPCEDVCPTDAIQRTESGVVWIDYNECIGCKSCMLVCPYGVISFFDGDVGRYEGLPIGERIKREYPKDVCIKCDLCRERVEKGLEKGLEPGEDLEATPLCVIRCPTEARVFGDLDDSDSEVSKLIKEEKGFQLYPQYETDPAVYYVR